MAAQSATPEDFRFFSGVKPRTFGHRGAAGTTPENTLPSFRRALDEGATHIELDIHETADGEIVVIHDDAVDRTTDGSGRIGEMSIEALRALDAGFRWTLDGQSYPYRGQGIRIPTLNEYFDAFPGVRTTVEAKTVSPAGVDNLLRCINDFGMLPDVLLAGFDDKVMGRLRQAMAKQGWSLATGYSFGEIHAFMTWLWTGARGDPPIRGQALQIPSAYQGRPLITAESVRAAHGLGLEVHAWTINERSEMQSLLDLGVDGIITDFPARMREFVA